MKKKVRCFTCGKTMGRGEYTVSTPLTNFAKVMLGERIYRHKRKCGKKAV